MFGTCVKVRVLGACVWVGVLGACYELAYTTKLDSIPLIDTRAEFTAANCIEMLIVMVVIMIIMMIIVHIIVYIIKVCDEVWV